MKNHLSILLCILLMLSLTGCGTPAPDAQTSNTNPHVTNETTSSQDSIAPETPGQGQDFFNAVVLEADLDTILAECTACESGAIPIGSKVTISTNTISSEEVPILSVGDAVRVVYIGDVLETDPLHFSEVISIFWIDESGEIITEPAPKSINQLDTPNWGITFTAENVTPTGLTLCCAQAGGEPTGDLETGSYFVLEKFENDTWEKVEYLPHEYDIAWTMEAWMIPTENTTEWDIKWEWLYGPLPTGQYRIGKEIMDFRGPGNYDTAMHYAEFAID